MKKFYVRELALICSLASGGLLSVYGAEFTRNPDKQIVNFSDEDAWISQSTGDYGTPGSGDTLYIYGDSANTLTNFSGDVEIYHLAQYGGTSNFTNDPAGDGAHIPSSFTATWRVYLQGGAANIYSYGDTPLTFTVNDAFALGDNASSNVTEDLTLNIYGNAVVNGNGWGLCFGELAQFYSVNVNISEDAVLNGKLLVGSKTLSESAKTVVTFGGNSQGQLNGVQMRENATLNIKGNSYIKNTGSDVNFFNEIQDSENKPAVNLSENGRLEVQYKIYQYKAEVNLADNSNINTQAYYLGAKDENATVTAKDILTIGGSASVDVWNVLNAYAKSEINISGTEAHLEVKTANLNGASINSSAASATDSEFANVSIQNLYIYNSGELKVSKGLAKVNTLELGYDGSNASEADMVLSGGAKYSGTTVNAYGNSKIVVDGANFELTKHLRANGLALNGANTLTLQNGATADLDRFAMYNENAKITLKGSGLNITAWCIGGDKNEDPNYASQAGKLEFVADANGISTLVSQYIDFNFDILLDFTDYTLLGENTFEILTVTSTYYDMVKNWVDDPSLIELIKANEGDSYTIGLADGGKTLTLTYSHVPEPAAYAAIFGALALAFAACRRRRR